MPRGKKSTVATKEEEPNVIADPKKSEKTQKTKKTPKTTTKMPKPKTGCSAIIANTRVLANIMRLFANNVQDGNMYFDDTGIHISGMDMSHVCLIRCNLTSDSMTYVPPENPLTIGVSFKVLAKILGACSSATCTTLKPDIVKGKLEVYVMTSKGEDLFVVRQMDIDQDEMEVPDMDYEITRNIETSTIKDTIDQAEKLGAEYVTITRTNTNEMRIKYTTDIIDGNVIMAEGGDEGLPINSVSVATSYLKGFLGAGPFGPNTQLCYDESNIPVRVKCPLVSVSGNISDKDFVEIHIAPRTEDDYEDYGDEDDTVENVREY